MKMKMVFDALGMSAPSHVASTLSAAAPSYAPLQVGVGARVMVQAKKVKDMSTALELEVSAHSTLAKIVLERSWKHGTIGGDCQRCITGSWLSW